MAETSVITRLHVVTDSENSYDQIGNIDGGGFQEDWLYKYLKSHGPDKLYSRLADMSYQITHTWRQVERDSQDPTFDVVDTDDLDVHFIMIQH